MSDMPTDLKHLVLKEMHGIGPIVGSSNTVGSHHISAGLLAEAHEQPKPNFWQRAFRTVAEYYRNNQNWINPIIRGASMALGLLAPNEQVHMVNVLQVRSACRDFLRVLNKQDAPGAV